METALVIPKPGDIVRRRRVHRHDRAEIAVVTQILPDSFGEQAELGGEALESFIKVIKGYQPWCERCNGQA